MPTDPSVRRLSPREEEIARLVADGLTTANIARRLGLKSSTVTNYIQNIKQRLDLAGRAEIAAWVRARRDPDHPEGRLRRADPTRLRPPDAS